MKKICIKNGILHLPDKIAKGVLWIENERITKISFDEKNEDNLNSKADTICIDAKGKLVFPGMIDAHVHFRTPGAEYKEDWFSGSKSAVSGGVTSVLDMPNNNPPVINSTELNNKSKLVYGNSLVNYGFFLGLTVDNYKTISKSVSKIPGIKIYMGSTTGTLLVDDESIIETIAKSCKTTLVFHAEDETRIVERTKQLSSLKPDFKNHSALRDKQTAILATKKIVKLAKKYPLCHFHIAHISTPEEMKMISEMGLSNLTMEVAPHHLAFTTNDYAAKKSFVQMNPPVRSPEDVAAMLPYIKNSKLSMIASDHAPHLIAEKERPYLEAPSGVPGVDISFIFLYNYFLQNNIDFKYFSKMISENASEIFNILHRGKLKKNYYADIVILDPNKSWTYTKKNCFSKCGWSPYEGFTFKGSIEKTIVNGKLVFENTKTSSFNTNHKAKELEWKN